MIAGNVSNDGAFLLLMLGLCVAVGYYQPSRRLREAEQELQARRDEPGYLSVADRTRLQAIAVDTDEPNTWRWRRTIRGVFSFPTVSDHRQSRWHEESPYRER